MAERVLPDGRRDDPGPHLRSRFLRRLGWILAALGGLAAIAGFATLETVDWRPHFQQPWFAATAARLEAAPARSAPAPSRLAAGFGRARLTPTIGADHDDPARGRFRQVPLAGYGARRGQPAIGTHDELEVKAVALRAGGRLLVMVGADALIVPPEVTALAMEQLGRDPHLDRHQVYLSATHTHASLGGWGEGLVAEMFAGGFQPGTRIWFAAAIVQAVRAAVVDLQPAELGQGRFAAPEFVRNRLVGALGRVDPDFSFAVIRQHTGRIAVLGSYAAHATVLSSSVMEFSGDYPGYWQRAVESATGGLAIFLAGGVGSHGPVAGEKGFAGAEKLGRALADRILAELPRTPLSGEVILDAQAVDVVLPELQVRVSDGIRLRPWLARRLLPTSGECLLQAFRLNDVIWFSTPCDYSGELALRLKDFLRARRADAVVTSFNGAYLGYVLPARYAHLPGYEPRTMSFHGPDVGEAFDETLRALAGRLLPP